MKKIKISRPGYKIPLEKLLNVYRKELRSDKLNSKPSKENLIIEKNKIFLMQLNRFMWEDVEKGVFRKNKRIRTVLKFENVIKVHSKNIDQAKKDKFLDFLTIETKKMPDNNYEMKIVFAGDSIIRVISEVVDVTLDDQGEAWDTKNIPKHKVIWC